MHVNSLWFLCSRTNEIESNRIYNYFVTRKKLNVERTENMRAFVASHAYERVFTMKRQSNKRKKWRFKNFKPVIAMELLYVQV